MKILVVPKESPDSTPAEVQISWTDHISVGDDIMIEGQFRKPYRVVWVEKREPIPQELHPVWQFLIKLLFSIGILAAMTLASILTVILLVCIGSAVEQIFHLLGG